MLAIRLIYLVSSARTFSFNIIYKLRTLVYVQTRAQLLLQQLK